MKYGLDQVVDTSNTRSGIRIRSGGRAATFLTNKGEYVFSDANVPVN